MYKNNKEKGITLIILIITVMILIIIAGIGIDSGLNIMRKANIESLKTDMLLIQAKGKEYVENANFNLGTGEKSEEEKAQIKSNYLKGTPASSNIPPDVKLNEKEEAYSLTSQDMVDMGLPELKDVAQNYMIVYNIEEEKVDIIYTQGLNYENTTYYTLSSIEDVGV